ncbi:MAG: chorismate-binding protein [Flavobacteriaceae bacterium]|nr:chorismate-binding protein [Flavobacteriaceae bacterium]MDH3796300.1 chorismate-binding protein [Flavobacteriaceae bacterium]
MLYQENKSSKELFKKVHACLGENTAFVLFKRPNADEVLGIFEDQSDTCHDTRFVFFPFETAQKGYEIACNSVISTPIIDIAVSNSKSPTPWRAAAEEKNRFISAVQQAQKAIAQGKLQKVVLSRSVALTGMQDPQHLFSRLVHSYTNAFCYWWFHPSTGHWLGASPELLLATRNNTAQIMSLAGTRKFKSGETVSWNEKEKEEQALVSAYIEDVLARHGASLKVEGPNTILAGSLVHLGTKFKASLQSDPDTLLKELHPTPAVCGIPKDEALEFIKENEGYAREYYTGYLGVLSSDPEFSSELYVNLRCMRYINNIATVYVGCGITAGSDPEMEWQETVDKSQTIFKILDISSH